MKAKLIKTEVNYLLENKEGVIIASTSLNKEGKSLSKQNCDELFGIVDVEKLVEEYIKDDVIMPSEKSTFIFAFLNGMELNKDKVFTLEDMYYIFQLGFSLDGKAISKLEYDTHIQSLQQPTEIDVEVEMYDFELPGKPIGRRIIKPKVDSEGCLILKRVV